MLIRNRSDERKNEEWQGPLPLESLATLLVRTVEVSTKNRLKALASLRQLGRARCDALFDLAFPRQNWDSSRYDA